MTNSEQATNAKDKPSSQALSGNDERAAGPASGAGAIPVSLVDGIKRTGKAMSARSRVLLLAFIIVTACAMVMVVMMVARYRRGFVETGKVSLSQLDGESTVRVLRDRHGTLERPAPLTITTSMTAPLSRDDQTGFYDQILIEAFRRAGQPVRIAHLPTERSITNADLGITDGEFPRISGLRSIYPNLRIVPEKIVDFEFVAFTWRTDIQITDWSSCKPYNVAIVTGWKILEANLADVKSLIRVQNQQLLFTLLAKHRADIVVYSRFEGYEMIRKFDLKSILALEPPLAKREMFLYLHKEHLPLIPEIAKQLRSIKHDGTYDRIFKKTLGIYSMDATERSDVP